MKDLEKSGSFLLYFHGDILVYMSLTADDLQSIRTMVQDAVGTTVRDEVSTQIKPLTNKIEAIHNDIKEIYKMISDLQSSTITDKSFKKKSLEDKLLTVNAELLAMAKQAGITLPR